MLTRDEIWDDVSLNCQLKYLLASRFSVLLVSESNVPEGGTDRPLHTPSRPDIRHALDLTASCFFLTLFTVYHTLCGSKIIIQFKLQMDIHIVT